MGSVKDGPHNHWGGNDGLSVEIFLFSNGQKDSPPRKYNVRVDDQWDTKLIFYARSQNGSNHTIELYTTDGKKIGKAQELSNGVAYVAVEPPQLFIPSGYNDYLMKASRSREKRQEKLPANDSVIKPDKTNSKHKTEEQITDGTNIKIVQDITIRPTSKTALKEQDATKWNVKSDMSKIAKPNARIKNKITQKKNSSLPQPNSNTYRKNTYNVTPPVKRKYIPKIDASEKVETSSYQNTKSDQIAKTIERESKSKGDVAGVITVIKNNKEIAEVVEAYDLLKNVDKSDVQHNIVTGYKSSQKLTVDSTIIERNILLPASQEKDVPKAEYTMPVNMPSKMNILSDSKQYASVPDETFILLPDKSPPLSGRPLAENPEKTDSIPTKTAEGANLPVDLFHQNAFIFGSQTGDNNFTIYVKQNDVGSLKLNIEVRNISNSMLEAKLMEVVNTKSEDPSKNRPRAKNNREALTLTEPWGAELPYEQLPKIVNDQGAVGQCDCCWGPKTDGVAPVYVDNNNYFILLPPEDLHDRLLSCACKLETNQAAKQEMPDNHELPKTKSHFVKPDEIKNSPTTDLNKTFESNNGETHDRMMAENRSPSDNGNTVEDVDDCDCCAPTCPAYAQNVTLDFLARDSQLAAYSDFPSDDLVANEHALINKNPKMFKDAFTQTDWSGLVLEVRPRENGSYEFHLPSLKVLKTTNSLYK